MTTLHANNTREALSRIETMTMMAGMELPHRAIREQVASAVDMIVQLSRMRDGSRRVTAVSEIQGMEGDVITMSNLFEFEQTGFENGKVVGALRPTGIRPKFMHKLEEHGVQLPPNIFGFGQRTRI